MAIDPVAPVAPAAPEAAEEEPPLFILQRQFPRIADAIELLWGDHQLEAYLQKLILADRGDRGDRAGFPKEVLAALLKLYNQHHVRFNFPSPEDKWAQEDRIDRVKFPPAPK